MSGSYGRIWCHTGSCWFHMWMLKSIIWGLCHWILSRCCSQQPSEQTVLSRVDCCSCGVSDYGACLLRILLSCLTGWLYSHHLGIGVVSYQTQNDMLACVVEVSQLAVSLQQLGLVLKPLTTQSRMLASHLYDWQLHSEIRLCQCCTNEETWWRAGNYTAAEQE